jgi:hypothetical protein
MQSIEQSMLGTAVTGKDLIVWLDGHDETPKTYEKHRTMTLEELKQQFGATTLVYLVNKNLQCMSLRIVSNNGSFAPPL